MTAICELGSVCLLAGARLKVMRCVQLKAPEDKRALLDFGLGVGVDLDRQVGNTTYVGSKVFARYCTVIVTSQHHQ